MPICVYCMCVGVNVAEWCRTTKFLDTPIFSNHTSARPEVRGTADVGWRSLNPLPINPPRTHSRLYHHMCLRTDGR